MGITVEHVSRFWKGKPYLNDVSLEVQDGAEMLTRE